MKIGFLPDINVNELSVYNQEKKSGSRIEYSLTLNDALKAMGAQMTDMPLRYASLVVAYEGHQDQEFHADSESGERAIVYLSDVNSETNGPIEFKHAGKILGKTGTYVHYNAAEIHRGCSSDTIRYALALAFDDDASKRIETVGIAPPPSPSPARSTTSLWITVAVLSSLLILFLIMAK